MSTSNEKTVSLGEGGPEVPGEASSAKPGYDPAKTLATPAPEGAGPDVSGAPTTAMTRKPTPLPRKLADDAEPRPLIPEVEIDDEIGRGGMGVVYRGRQTYLDRKVAVKLLLVAAAANQKSFVDRFRREAKILAGLSHPNIVGCYQANQLPSGECYLVMEFIDGPNLRSWVEKSGPLAEVHALEVTRSVACALGHAAASGIIHRDVKPENVLLQPVAEQTGAGIQSSSGGRRSMENRFPFTAKLVDLGLARPTAQDQGGDAGRLTAEGVVMGTPSTMAPEQIDDPDHVDHRADIYGLGCVLYHILTGEPAFPERNVTQILLRKARGDVPRPAALRPGLRKEVADLVEAMLQPRREARPQSYDDVIARCDGLLAEAAASPKGVGTRRYYKAPDAKSGEVLQSPEAASRGSGVTSSSAGAQTVADLGARPGAPAGGGASKVAIAIGAVVLLGIGWVFVKPLGKTETPPGAGASSGVSSSAPAGALGASSSAPAPPARVAFNEPLAIVMPAAKGDASIFPGWDASVGVPFGPEEDSDRGIQSNPGTGGRSLTLGAGPWRVSGALLRRPAAAPKLAGVAVHGKERGVAINLRSVPLAGGVKQLVDVETMKADASSPIGWAADRALTASIDPDRTPGLDRTMEVSFSLSLEGETVHVRVGGKDIASTSLAGDLPTKLTIFVERGAVIVRDLKKATPQ